MSSLAERLAAMRGQAAEPVGSVADRVAALRRTTAAPSLVPGGGLYAAEDRAQADELNYDELMSNTFAQLVESRGRDSVRPVLTSRGVEDFDVLDAQSGKWVRYNAQQEIRRLAEMRQNALLQSADTESGAAPKVRFQTSFKSSPDGKLAFLRETYGPENVREVYRNGGVANYLFREKGGQWTLFDPEGARLSDIGGDVADIGGDIAEALPGAVAGGIGAYIGRSTGSPGAVAAGAGAIGDVIGSAGRQMIGAALPGDERMTAAERLTSGAVNVGTGLVGEGLMGGGKALYGAIGPSPRYTRDIGKNVIRGGKTAEKLSRTINRGRQLERTIGEPLSAAELANTEAGAGFQTALARNTRSADVAGDAQRRKTLALAGYVDKQIDAISKEAREDAGERTVKAIDKLVDELMNVRRQNAEMLFTAAEEAAGGKRVISVTGTKQAIADLLAEENTPFRSESGKRIIKGLESRLADLTSVIAGEIEEQAMRLHGAARKQKIAKIERDSLRLSPSEINKALHDFGEVAQGRRFVIEGLDATDNERIGKRIFSALQQDLDAAIADGKTPGQVAEALRRAREQYRIDSEDIESTQTEIMKRAMAMDRAGSLANLPKAVLENQATPQQIKAFMLVAKRASPSAAASMRAAALGELMTDASRGGEFSAQSFATLLSNPRKWQKVKALFAGDDDAMSSLTKLRYALEYAERITKKGTASGYSPTTPLRWTEQIVKAQSLINLGGLVERVREAIVPLSDPRKMALVLNDPSGREALLGIVKPTSRPVKSSIVRHVDRLAAILARGEAETREPITGEAEEPQQPVNQTPARQWPPQSPEWAQEPAQ